MAPRLPHRLVTPRVARVARGARGLALGFALVAAMAPAGAIAHDREAGDPVPRVSVRTHYFEVIAPEEPLAQNLVTAIAQTPDGFLWIGTQGGLHRYDGYRFTLYEHDPQEPGSLADGFVSALAVDREGFLVVGGGRGSLQRLEAHGNRFEPVGPASETAARGHVGRLVPTADGALWIASRRGIERLDADGRSTVVLEDATSGFDFVQPRSMVALPDGLLAAATGDGLALIDPANLSIRPIAPGIPRVYSLAVGCDGLLRIGTLGGLYLLDRDGALRRLWPVESDETPGGPVHGLVEDAEGRWWLAVFGAGLAILDPRTGRVDRLRHAHGIDGTLPEDSIRHLFLDHLGLLWIGGETRGLIRANPAGARFTLVTDQNPGRSFAATNGIRSLWQSSDGALWVGTDGDGLKRIDLETRAIGYYRDALLAPLPNGSRGRELRINAIVPMADGRLWLPSNRGVLEFDPSSASTRLAWPTDPGTRAARQHARMAVLDPDGHVWIATWQDGLVRFDPKTGSQQGWRHDPDRADSLSHDSVIELYRDRKGMLWVGTLDGLDRLDPGTGRLTRMPRAGSGPGAPAGDVVRGVVETSDGSLWFASHGGLSRLAPDQRDAEAPAFERLTPREGLPARMIYDLLPAPDERTLWLATNRGLVRMDLATREFRRYGIEDGLQGLEYNGGAALTLADGRLAFGGVAGLNVFDPSARRAERPASPLVLTRLSLGDRLLAAPAGGWSNPIRLDEAERTLRFEFAVLDFAAPRRNRFEQRLEGLQPDWESLGTRNELMLSALPPGSYRLRVRAWDSEGQPAANELDLPFVVPAPWWQTPAARAAMVAVALLLVGGLIVAGQRRLARERAHAAALREREERLRVAIWGSGDEFWDWDLKAGKLFRIGADNLLGLAYEDTISGDEWRRQAVHPEDLGRVERILDEHVRGERDAFESEHRVRRADGEYIWVRARGRIVERDEQGRPLRVAGTARDITMTRAAERERLIAREVIRSMSEAVVVTDLDFRFTSINPAFTRMTGYTEQEIVGLDSSILDCDQHDMDFQAALREQAVATVHWSGEIWQRRKDGEEFLCWLELSQVCDAAGQRTHFVAVLSDITDRKRAEQELRYLANYDTLTGLPNRTLLGERLAHALIRARRHGTRVALLFLDLDRFKHVNDSLGHAAGDRLLKAAAARIQANVRDIDTVARLGGDEFTVVAEDLTGRDEAERLARQLLEAFQQPIGIDERTEIVISPSIGISLFPDHGQVPTDLLKFADTAMYRAKEQGRNTYAFYSPALDAEARWRVGMVGHLHKALERNELSLVYQPKMSLATGEITGVEALLRWNNLELGRVGPATFVPLAEETGLIIPIGEWVLREALREARAWARAGVGNVSVAVNVSMLQLLRGDLVPALRRALDETGLPPTRVVLELTESMIMDKAEQSISTLVELKTLGVSIAIDDFGTGYSSLSQLKRLPIDTLKIDKSFVGEISLDADDEAITATVISMAHTLGLDVVAEGVETPEQLAYLRDRDCDEVQGYLVSPPLPGDAMLSFLLEWRSRRPFGPSTPAASEARRG